MKKIVAMVAVAAFVSLAQAQNFGTWAKYRDITINTTGANGGADVAGDVTDFPVLIRLTDDSDATGADVLSEALANGEDVRFSNEAGTEALAYEIDHWSETSAAIWVNVPEVEGNDNTTIRMYWDRQGTPDGSDANAVFPSSNGFVGAWHLGGPDGNRANATFAGPAAVPSIDLEEETFSGRSRPGIIGLADSLQGASSPTEGEYFDVSPMPGFGEGFTFSAWTQITSTEDRTWMRIFDFGNGEAVDNIFFGRQAGSEDLIFDVFPGQSILGEGEVVTGEWRHLAVTISSFDEVAQENTTRVYINGVEVATGGATYGDVERVSSFVGRSNWPDATFTGYLDEVRVSGEERSADWLKLSHETQKEGVSAVTLGTSETQGVKAMYYGSQNPTYLVNEEITPNTPVVSGSASGFSVTSGTLPDGLDLDGSSGVISGTPTEAAEETQVVVEATVDASEVSDTLWITITAGDPPGAPTGVSVDAGNTEVAVSWNEPAVKGTGDSITSYIARAVQDTSKTCEWTGGEELSCTVMELTNGEEYSFLVAAVNVVGQGPYSDTSATVTPATVPSAPTGVTATQSSGDGATGSATVSWTEPASDGGAAIAGTFVFGSPSGACFAPAPSTSCAVSALEYDTEYTFRAAATNAVGAGDTSAPSEGLTPVNILPGSFAIHAQGNPFTFVLSQDAIASTEAFTMSISDIWGRTVWSRTIHPAKGRGESEISWNGRNTSGHPVSAGMYLVRISTVSGKNATNYIRKAISTR